MYIILVIISSLLASASSANVQEGAAFIEGISTGSCPTLRGYFNLQTSTNTYSFTLPNIATACPNVGAKQVQVSIFPLSRSFSGDATSMFGASNKAHDLFDNAALSHPYTLLSNTVSNNVPSEINLIPSSSNSILGRSIVVSIGGVYVASGVIGRRSVASTDVNTAGSAKLSGQSPTLLCKLSDSSLLDAGSPVTKLGAVVISVLANSGGVVIAAKLTTGFTGSSNQHRISLHKTIHVPENLNGKNTAMVAGNMLGEVLTYSSTSTSTSTGTNLPCSSSAKAGDLGNFQGGQYYGRLPIAAGSGWEELVGASCAIWNKPLRTCTAWQVGCTSYDATDSLLAVGVVGLSDGGARLEELGKDLSSLSSPSNGANYDCLSKSTILAQAHLYKVRDISSSADAADAADSASSVPIATVVFVQNQISSSVALTVTLATDTVPDWLSTSSSSTLRALSIQTTGDGSYGMWDGRTISNLDGIFHPVSSHKRALPPNELRRSGDIGNYDLSTQQSYEYYMDTSFGEKNVALEGIKSIIGRGFALHALSDTGLGMDTNRGAILAFGIISTPKPFKNTQKNLARGSILQQEQLICVLRNVKSSKDESTLLPHGVLTIDLKHPSEKASENQNRTSFVTVSGTFSNLYPKMASSASASTYEIEIFEYGDATGSRLGSPIGSIPSSTTMCYDLSRFGWLGEIKRSTSATNDKLLYSYLKPPQDGSLSSLVGKSCVLNEIETNSNGQKNGRRTPVAVGIFALVKNNFEPLHVSNSVNYNQNILQDCHMAPNGKVKIPSNTTINDGTMKDSQVALIVGLSIGIPLGLCVFVGCWWSIFHYTNTHKTIKKTMSLRRDIQSRSHMSVGKHDHHLPAPPLPLMYDGNGSDEIARPMSYRMPNGRVQSVRIGRGKRTSMKPLPSHPHHSLKAAAEGIIFSNRLEHMKEHDQSKLIGSGGVEVEMSSM